MVICGYSEEDKVYIVRNSWGKGFGDSGYCYIPFSYIEDSYLSNSACIITAINEGEEVKGGGHQTIVAFNKTDMEIRYSIIRILVDEEKQLLIKVRIVLRFFLKLPASGDFPTFFIYFYLVRYYKKFLNFLKYY